MIWIGTLFSEDQADQIEEILKDMELETDVRVVDIEQDEYYVGFDHHNYWGMSRDEFENYVITELIKRCLK